MFFSIASRFRNKMCRVRMTIKYLLAFFILCCWISLFRSLRFLLVAELSTHVKKQTQKINHMEIFVQDINTWQLIYFIWNILSISFLYWFDFSNLQMIKTNRSLINSKQPSRFGALGWAWLVSVVIRYITLHYRVIYYETWLTALNVLVLSTYCNNNFKENPNIDWTGLHRGVGKMDSLWWHHIYHPLQQVQRAQPNRLQSVQYIPGDIGMNTPS